MVPSSSPGLCRLDFRPNPSPSSVDLRPPQKQRLGARYSLGRGGSPSLEACKTWSEEAPIKNRFGLSGENARESAAVASWATATRVEVILVPTDVALAGVAPAASKDCVNKVEPFLPHIERPDPLPGRKDFERVRRTLPPGLRPRSVWPAPTKFSLCEQVEKICQIMNSLPGVGGGASRALTMLKCSLFLTSEIPFGLENKYSGSY